VGAVDRGARDGMAEGLGLRLRGWRCGERGLSLGGGGGGGEKLDFLGDGAAQVVEGLAEVGWVVVGFVGILRSGNKGVTSAGEQDGMGVGEVHTSLGASWYALS